MSTRSSPALPRVVLMIAAILTIAPPGGGADDRPVATEASREVRRLLEQLGSRTRAERAAAERRLLELGTAALEHLPPPELIDSVSARAAVDRVRNALEQLQARESLRASRVTLAGRRPLTDWLTEITRQTGNPLHGDALPRALADQSMELSLSDREFWQALDVLSERAEIDWIPDPAGRGLRPVPRGGRGAPGARSVRTEAGPFRVTSNAATVVPIGSGPVEGARQRLLRVPLQIQAEPRLRPLFLHVSPESFEGALDSDSRKLSPFNPEATYELPIADPSAPIRLPFDYLLPEGPLPRTLDFAGRVQFTVAAGSAAIRFAGVSELADGREIGVERRRGGVTVRLERVRQERCPGGLRELLIRVVVAFDAGGPAFESHRTWILHNEVFLEDAEGERLPLNGGYETTRQADGAVGMEYRFRELPDPLPELAFVYVAPTLIVDAPVEFRLESVPVEAPDK